MMTGFVTTWSKLVQTGQVTHPADEAFRVPESIKGRDVVLQDSTGTSTTFRGKHVKVVLSAECFSILLMET